LYLQITRAGKAFKGDTIGDISSKWGKELTGKATGGDEKWN